jgi:hypothetical protein
VAKEGTIVGMDKEQLNKGGGGIGLYYSRKYNSDSVVDFKQDNEGALPLSKFSRSGCFSYDSMTCFADFYNMMVCR